MNYFSLTALLFGLVIFLWLLVRLYKAIMTVHQNDWGQRWINFIDGLNYLYCKYYHRFQYTPIELPQTGPAIVVANHSSGLDGNLMIAASHRPLRFLIAREYYEHFGFKWFFKALKFIPVDRSRHPESALREALRALEAGEVIGLFPQGGIASGKSRQLKRGVLWLAQRSNTPIYPVFLSGISKTGHVFKPFLWRSHVNLYRYPLVSPQDENLMEHLQTLLEGNGEKETNPNKL
jgi:1-acyl-sn-glycerol-3-phosphate acyltransferase